MNATQINSGMLAMLNISNYGHILKDPDGCLRLKTTALISADRTFDIMTRSSKFKKVNEMKLVDILARELKVWPDHMTHLWVSAANTIYGKNGSFEFEMNGGWDKPEDHRTVSVSRAEWQAAVDALSAPKVVEWNGAGLPPIGIDCEMKKADSWVLVNILAQIVDDPRFNPIAIYMEANDPSARVGQAVASRFRSIRTAEQVAAEEREKAVADLYFTINWNEGRETWPFISNGRKADYEKAIDAGYAKVAK